MGILAWVAKLGLIAGGTILSLVSAGSLIAVGAPLVVAGAAIDVNKSGTQDLLSTYASTLVSVVPGLQAAQTTARKNAIIDSILAFFQNNIMLIIVGIAAFFLILKRKRGR